ncbi:hypothetical protein AWB69_06977 [Caballeronia udeis]|uniref:Uncharacterized protein n=1 Tax=Caballeronia udeis TaxID=1232866 RepID=A0A158J0V2_9BURK|nr:hypothetical protein AWB69_06977 [Caballeronia udeis]
MVMVSAGAVVMHVTRLMLVAVVMMVMSVVVVMVVLMTIRVLVRVLRLRFHLFVIRSEVGLRLGDVLEQFGQHAADVVIGGEIENLLAFTLGAYDPRRPQ